MLSQKELEFLNKRKSLVSSWKIVGVSSLLMLAILLLWLFIKTPYLANPLFVANALKAGSLDESTMALASLILPILVIFSFASTMILVLYGFAIVANEKKYLAIIKKLSQY